MSTKAIECNRMQSNVGECSRMLPMQSDEAHAVKIGECNRMRKNSSAVNFTRMQSITSLRVYRMQLAVTPSGSTDIRARSYQWI